MLFYFDKVYCYVFRRAELNSLIHFFLDNITINQFFYASVEQTLSEGKQWYKLSFDIFQSKNQL